jgi:hypothetical protein
MATKLTPEALRRIILEEKQKLESKMLQEKKAKSQEAMKLDKKALKDLKMEMDKEEWPGEDSMETVEQVPGEKLKTLKMLKEEEENLLRRARALQERRLALRKQILRDIT